jgi:serine/threonine-protein kinase
MDSPTRPGVPPPQARTAFERLESGPVRALEQPGEHIGRYRLTAVLGEGGMGRVYEAYDPELGRVVALKVVRRASPHAVARILQEARSQAKVDHPGICKIFEVGHDGDTPFIVMQRIRGQDLEQARESLSVEEKVLVVKLAAEALHAAHREGLIHRDLKPANLMVERREDGGLQPTIMDFGLARHLESQGLTAAGQLVGTPAYMPPEQARGDGKQVDRRSDVYGLGATLFKLLTGHAPFEADTVPALLDMVVREEVRSLHSLAPWIPEDLNTIVMKCLEKSPSARYASARALAEDLGRFLDGEPIEARPVGALGAALRKLRKHRRIAAVAAVSGLLVLGSSGWALRANLRARAIAVNAQRFGQEAERLEGFLRQARLLPPHDLTLERALVQERLKVLEQEIAESGAWVQGPGRYALGRVRLALGDAGEARAQLERAHEAGYRTPATQRALGMALAELYQRSSNEARFIPSKDRRTARQAEINRLLREPALACLRNAEPDPLESPDLAAARVAWVDGRLDEALAGCRRVLQRQPWLYEAGALAAEALLMSHDKSYDYPKARADFQEADRLLLQAREVARSDERLAVLQARIAIAAWYNARQTGGSGEPEAAAVLRATDEALALDPRHPQAWEVRGNLLRATALGMDSADPARVPRAQESVRCLRMALGEAETRGEARDRLGALWTQLGHAEGVVAAAEMASGKDPQLAFDRAREAFQRARGLAPDLELVDHGEGDLYSDRGLWELGMGLDPRDSYAKAEQAYQRVLSRRPTSLSALNNLGYTYKDWARYLAGSGEDARAMFAKSEDAFRRALSVNPDYAIGWNNFSVVASYLAGIRLSRGQDPTPLCEEGLRRSDRAIAINPKDGNFYIARMEHWTWKARWARAQGRGGQAELREASASLDKGLELRPNSVYGLLCRARLRLLEARWALEDGRGNAPLLAEAERVLGTALALNPKEAELLEARAMAFLLRPGRLAIETGRAEADARAALRINPRSTAAMLLLAEIERRKALQGDADAVPRGLAWTRQALQVRKGQAEALALQGVLRLAGADRGGLEDLKASLRANPLEDTDLYALPPRLASAALKGRG